MLALSNRLVFDISIIKTQKWLFCNHPKHDSYYPTNRQIKKKKHKKKDYVSVTGK